MLFFNPATLLPDPSVAVKPPPQGNQGFVIQEALKEVGSLVQKKFDVDALKKESNLLADYVQNKSPELSSYLRESASGFNIGTTDPNQVRGNLLKGTLSMLEMEQNDRKVEDTAAMSGQYNMYGTKLTNDQKEYSDAVNAFNAFEKEENDLKTAHDERNKYLRSQNQFTTPYVRRINPHKDRMDQAKANFEITRSSTPSVVPKKSSVTVGGKAADPFLPTQDMNQPPDNTLLNPGDDASAVLDNAAAAFGSSPAASVEANAALINEAPPTESVATPAQSAVTIGQEPPLLVTDKTPVAPVGTNSVLKPAPASSVLQPPDFPNTPENAAVLAARKADTELVQTQAAAIVNQLTENKALYINKEAYEKVKEEAKEAIAKIESFPDPGSVPWTKNAKSLLRIIKDRADGLAKNTISQENKEAAVENQRQVTFKVAGSTTGQTIKAFVRKLNGVDRYFAYVNNVETDVTNDFQNGKYVLMDTTANGVSVTDPKASIPSSMDSLIKKGK